MSPQWATLAGGLFELKTTEIQKSQEEPSRPKEFKGPGQEEHYQQNDLRSEACGLDWERRLRRAWRQRPLCVPFSF